MEKKPLEIMRSKGASEAVELCEKHGFGHIIAVLKREWAERLVRNEGMSKDDALRLADADAYPLRLKG